MRRGLKWCLLAVILVGGTYAGTLLATPSSGFTGTTLAVARFGEIDVKNHTLPADTWQARLKTQGISDVYVQNNTWVPGGSTGWHTHPGHSLILVTEGAVTAYEGHDPPAERASTRPAPDSSTPAATTCTCCGTKGPSRRRPSRCSSSRRTPRGESTCRPRATARSSRGGRNGDTHGSRSSVRVPEIQFSGDHDDLALYLALQEPGHRGGSFGEGDALADGGLDPALGEPGGELLDVAALSLRMVLRPVAPGRRPPPSAPSAAPG